MWAVSNPIPDPRSPKYTSAMPHPLDDASFVTRLDPKELLRLTREFPDQCRRALKIAQDAQLPALSGAPASAVLTGMGGSAAGGDFVKALFEAEGSIPFSVNRDYHLPLSVGPDTLVIASSYSGNTEETLSAYAEARGRSAQILGVTSGGTLAAQAEHDGVPVIRIPGGQPPRTALGYMLVPVVVACERHGLLPEHDHDAAWSHLEACVESWDVETPFVSNPAKQLAAALQGAVGILYGLGPWQAAVANRWKGQINENAKNLAFASAFPELNHNEILGWVKATEQGVGRWVTVVLRDGNESAKMNERARVTMELTHGVSETYSALAPGETLWQRILALTLMGDFVSLYLAALNGVDPENIDSINVLKASLAKVTD